MSTTKSDTDPTMAANAFPTKTQGKLADHEIEYFLRDIEEKGLDPFFMSAKIQVWDKNEVSHHESSETSWRHLVYSQLDVLML